VLAYSNDAGTFPAYDINAYGGPNLGGEFHWGLTRKFVLTAALDFGYFSHTIFPYPSEDEDQASEIKAHYMSFGLGIGAKLYFWEPKASEAVLYGILGVGKYFAVCGNNDQLLQYDPDDDEDALAAAQDAINKEADIIAGLASPFVVQLGIGAEFFATESFSIGADLLGIRLAFSKADVGQAEAGGMAEAAWSGEQKLLSIYIYSALTMTFNLTAGEGRKAEPEAAEGEGEGEGWQQESGESWGTGGDWGAGAAKPAPANEGWGAAPTPTPAPAPPKPAPTPSPAPSSEPPPPPPPPGY
jgi:hypothetical protein